MKHQTTIRTRLLIDLVILLGATGGVMLLLTWYAGSQTAESLAQSLIHKTAEQTDHELESFFGAVQANVLMAREWAEAGMLDATDHEAMNKLFVPVLKQNPQLSSMMVADSNGAEYLLLRDPLSPDQWTNRVVQADKWGTRVFNRTWNTETGEVDEGFGQLAYDPRTRIWYEQALTTTAGQPISWTNPVIFFVTKDPGITASTHWNSSDEDPATIVVAFDLLLFDISRFTSGLEVSANGHAFVVVENAGRVPKVIGLPKHPRFDNQEAIRKALIFVPPEAAVADSDAQLPPVNELGMPALVSVMTDWEAAGRPRDPIHFAADGQNWWGGVQPYALGDQSLLIGVVVPESDLLGTLRRQQFVFLAAIGLVLVVGVFRAAALARRFSAPIERLAQESERISQGDLEQGNAVESEFSEIRGLADAHDKMREGLKAVIKLEKIERDLDIARDIQLGLLPTTPPDTPGFEVAGWNHPADKTGGDYFDWQTMPDGRTVFTLADVTGHGIGPALIVAVYRAYLRSAMNGDAKSLATQVGRVNDLLHADIPDDRFITAAVGVLDPAKHTVSLLSAGQAPLLFHKNATDTVHNWDADDLPLGVTGGLDFEGTRSIDFAPGDTLLIATDGFFEASNSEGELFGTERIQQFLRDHHELPLSEFIERMYEQVQQHMEGEEQQDDLTALVIRRNLE